MYKKKSTAVHKTADEIRSSITDKIVEALKKGTPPWRCPWVNNPNSGTPANFASKRRYSGVNPLILMLNGLIDGYTSRYWGTGASWMKKIGAQITKGQKATYVILFKKIPKKDAQGNVVRTVTGKEDSIFLMREFPVFNAEQLKAPDVKALLGVPIPFGIVRSLLEKYKMGSRTEPTTKDELLTIANKYHVKVDDKATREEIALAINSGITAKLNSFKVIAEVVANTDPDFGPAEELLKATKADIRSKGDNAFYRPDFIQVPPKRSFRSMTDYYQTVFHELIHWTVNGKRVTLKQADVKSRDMYAFNELIAEIGSCFILTEMGVPLAESMLPKSQAYLQSWLKHMGDDHRFIFDAATEASKAVDFVLAFVGKQNPAYEEEEAETDSEDTHRKAA